MSRILVNGSKHAVINKDGGEGSTAKEINYGLRIQLAAAHRGLAQLGFQDRIFNHISVRAPRADGKPGEMILITPPFVQFDEVTPKNILGVLINTGELVEHGEIAIYNPGAELHRGIYLARPETVCAVHTHSPYIKVLASLEDTTLLMLEQTAIPLYNRIAYDNDYGGFTGLEDGKNVGKLLGPDKDVIIQQNHGSVVVGNNVWDAYNDTLILELSAKNQIKAMKTGRKLKEIPDYVCAKAFEQNQMNMDDHVAKAQLWGIISKQPWHAK